MPYIIETRYSDCDFPESCGECDISRTAVATLDEARAHLRGLAWHEDRHSTRVLLRNVSLCMPEDGGTIGPLPDGTVIEVRPVDWHALTQAAINHGGTPPLIIDTDADRGGILAAFNSR